MDVLIIAKVLDVETVFGETFVNIGALPRVKNLKICPIMVFNVLSWTWNFLLTLYVDDRDEDLWSRIFRQLFTNRENKKFIKLGLISVFIRFWVCAGASKFYLYDTSALGEPRFASVPHATHLSNLNYQSMRDNIIPARLPLDVQVLVYCKVLSLQLLLKYLELGHSMRREGCGLRGACGHLRWRRAVYLLLTGWSAPLVPRTVLGIMLLALGVNLILEMLLLFNAFLDTL